MVRTGVHIVLPVNYGDLTGWVAIAEKQLFYVSDNGQQIESIFRIERGKRPLRRGICLFNNTVLLGDYWGNPARKPVNIHVVHLKKMHKILFQFSENCVRHIHTVELDPYTETLWVSTGDNDSECMIFVLDPQSGTLIKKIGYGSQKWRTVSFAFRSDAVYWGTDNHMGENKIWQYDRLTCTTKDLGNVTGPVYYNICLNDYIVFGTSMEKGEGQQDGYGHLYAVDRAGNINEVWRLKKDFLGARFFGYGVFEFGEGYLGDNLFWVTAKGFKGGLRSFLLQIEER